MFRVVAPASVTIPLTLTAPNGTAGEVAVTIKYRSIRESVEYLQHVQREEIDDRQVLEETIVTWAGLEDEDGRELRWEDPEARTQVLDLPFVFFPLRDAVLDALAHGEFARKN